MKNRIDIHYRNRGVAIGPTSRTLVIKEEGSHLLQVQISDDEAIGLAILLLESHPSIYSNEEVRIACDALLKIQEAKIEASNEEVINACEALLKFHEAESQALQSPDRISKEKPSNGLSPELEGCSFNINDNGTTIAGLEGTGDKALEGGDQGQHLKAGVFNYPICGVTVDVSFDIEPLTGSGDNENKEVGFCLSTRQVWRFGTAKVSD